MTPNGVICDPQTEVLLQRFDRESPSGPRGDAMPSQRAASPTEAGVHHADHIAPSWNASRHLVARETAGFVARSATSSRLLLLRQLGPEQLCFAGEPLIVKIE